MLLLQPCLTSCRELTPCVRCVVLNDAGEAGEGGTMVDCSECTKRLVTVNFTSNITGSNGE